MQKQPIPEPVPAEADDSLVFAMLLKLGAGPEEAYACVRELQRMASENLIARFEAGMARLEAGMARLEAQREARLVRLESEVKALKRVMYGVGIGTATIVAVLQMLRPSAG